MENKDNYEQSPYAGGKVKSSLKQRIKSNCRRFASPIGVHTSVKSNVTAELVPNSLDEIDNCSDKMILETMHCSLKKDIAANEDKIQKMDLVKNYSLKNKDEELDGLTQKWLTASQDALKKLREKLPETDFPTLLKNLNINYDLVQYNPDCDLFF